MYIHDSCVAQTTFAHTLTNNVCTLNTWKKSFKDSCIWSCITRCAWNSAASTKSSLVRFRPAVGYGRFSADFYWILTLCSFKFGLSEVPGCPLPFLRAGSHELLAWVRNKSPIQWFGSTAKDDKKRHKSSRFVQTFLAYFRLWFYVFSFRRASLLSTRFA